MVTILPNRDSLVVPATNVSVLIVDDEDVVRKSLRRVLARQSMQCVEASNAEDALCKMVTNPSDIAILDIMMPGKSGIELLQEMKTLYPKTAVIMITAVNDIGTVTRCMKAGAADYIPKPFDSEEVWLSVQHTLEKRKLEIEIDSYRQGLENQVEVQDVQIRQVFLGAIESLASALEAKDKYTAGHSQRVAELATNIGLTMSMSPGDVEDLRCAALLHDIGKVAVDPAVQNKPGKLTPEEYRHIMIHAQVGPDIVKPLVNEKIVEMIRHHHDRYDGQDTHQTVAGKDIPIGARIIAVADALDAMTTDRYYRRRMSKAHALQEIQECAGSQFDPRVVSALKMAVICYDNASFD